MRITSMKPADEKGRVPLAVEVKPEFLPAAFQPQVTRSRFSISGLLGGIVGKQKRPDVPQTSPAFAVQIKGNGVTLTADGADSAHFEGDIDAPVAAEAARVMVDLASMLEQNTRTEVFGQAMKRGLLETFTGATPNGRTTAALAARLSQEGVRVGLLAVGSLQNQYKRTTGLTEGGKAVLNEAFRQAGAFENAKQIDVTSLKVLAGHIMTILRNLPTDGWPEVNAA